MSRKKQFTKADAKRLTAAKKRMASAKRAGYSNAEIMVAMIDGKKIKPKIARRAIEEDTVLSKLFKGFKKAFLKERPSILQGIRKERKLKAEEERIYQFEEKMRKREKTLNLAKILPKFIGTALVSGKISRKDARFLADYFTEIGKEHPEIITQVKKDPNLLSGGVLAATSKVNKLIEPKIGIT